MKVLAAIVVPPHLSVSGGARAAELLSDALRKHCDISVASMLNGTGSGAQGIERLRVQSWLPPLVPWSRLPNRYSTLFYRSSLPSLLRSGDFDVVHIHNPMPALEMERVANACIQQGKPYVVSTHGFNEVANGGQVYGFDAARRFVWKALVEAPVARVVARASAVFALSAADFEIVRSMGFTGSELTTVANGVPIPDPVPSGKDAPILARLGLSPHKDPKQITCMFLANHTPNKGLPVLLEAFARLKRPYLLIVGGETREGVDYDAYVRRCGPGQQIVVTGRLSDEEVGATLRRSDLFVFPTLADTFPLVVLEAMAHAVPVLASRVGGIPHQVTPECGALVAPNDAGALHVAIDALAAEPMRLAEMGRQARIRVATHFTWEKAANVAASAYERILRKQTSMQPRSMLAADASRLAN